MTSPRYLYWSVGLMVMLSSFSSCGSSDFSIFRALDFSCPTWILHLFAISSLVFLSCVWSGLLFVIRITSSTHVRHVDLSRLGCS